MQTAARRRRTMVLGTPGRPIGLRCLAVPEPGPGQLLLRVRACGVRRTDLHRVDGELPAPTPCLVPVHGIVEACGGGPAAERVRIGARVGVP